MAPVARQVAVDVTDSTFVRGFMRALARGEPGFKVFSLAEIDATLEYVEVPRGDWANWGASPPEASQATLLE